MRLTITLDEEIATWVRAQAAWSGKSVSRYIGERLAQEMRQVAEQLAALDGFISGAGWKGVAKDIPRRNELYDRPALRRVRRARSRGNRKNR
jgi:hypothetical protein